MTNKTKLNEDVQKIDLLTEQNIKKIVEDKVFKLFGSILFLILVCVIIFMTGYFWGQ